MPGLGIALAMLAVGCAGAGALDSPSRGDADVRELRDGRAVVLPARLPPRIREIHAVTGDGLPLVSFYSTNEPTVTVCTGPLDRCRALTDPLATLRASQSGGPGALVTIDRAEVEAPPPSADVRRFWLNVELTTREPAWLRARR